MWLRSGCSRRRGSEQGRSKSILTLQEHRGVAPTGPWRTALCGTAFAAAVAVHPQSLHMAVVFSIIALLAARLASVRVMIAVVASLTIAGVPWILSTVIGGVVWALVAGRNHTSVLMSEGFTGRRLVAGYIAGGLLGSAAIPFVRLQASNTPMVFDIPRPPTLLVAVLLLVFALANALGEELVWRGALLSETAGLSAPGQYIILTLSFGVAHYHGLPGGFVGVALSGVAGGILLLVRRRWGFISAVGAHFVADVVIFGAVLPWVFFAEVWVY